MECPVCVNAMTTKTNGGITVDVCAGGCGGIWLDRYELMRVDETHESAGESLLEVDRDQTLKVDLSKRLHCPKCHDVVMMRHFFSDKSKERAVGRFSPISNPEYVLGPGDKELSKLIATDVLSEGLNLQDCDKIINYDLHWNPVRLIQRFGRIDRIGTTYEEIYGYNFLPETGIEENLGLKEKLQQRIREIQETIGEDGKILDPSEQVNHEALYAIYGTDDGGQQSLALFDEGGDEDDDLVDLGEAIEMFRQMREEDHEEFHRIATLRDGIRAARKRPAGSNPEGRAYVFCRAGEHRRFYSVDASGEPTEISTQGFLAALRCEKWEKGLEQFPSGHNAAVSAARKSFTRHLERVRAQQAGQSELPRGQRYALKQLRELYGQLGSEERRERIERLEEVFRFETNMAARRELNGIHRAKLTGDELVEALERLYTKYRLGETRGDSRERRRAEADLVARIVVSEAVSS